MAEFPAIPLWTDAYLADTRHLSTEEHGAYLLLLMEAWRRPSCSLPDDAILLSRLAGLSPARWAEVAPIVMAFWVRDGRKKTWTQKRLFQERAFVHKKSASQAEKAAKRWNKTGKPDAAALPDGCPADAPTPTPTPSKKEREEPKGSLSPDGDLGLAFAAYNDTAEAAGWPKAALLNAKRKAALRQRLAECGGIEGWRHALAKARASPHCCGQNDRGWTASFDFLTQASSFAKLMEGNYDQRRIGGVQPAAQGPKRPDPALEQIARLTGLGETSGLGGAGIGGAGEEAGSLRVGARPQYPSA